jgi:hypothetical protein
LLLLGCDHQRGLRRPAMDGVLNIPVNGQNDGILKLIVERVIGHWQHRKALAADRPHGFSGRAAHFTVQFSLRHDSSPKVERNSKKRKKGRLVVKPSSPEKKLVVGKAG